MRGGGWGWGVAGLALGTGLALAATAPYAYGGPYYGNPYYGYGGYYPVYRRPYYGATRVIAARTTVIAVTIHIGALTTAATGRSTARPPPQALVPSRPQARVLLALARALVRPADELIESHGAMSALALSGHCGLAA